MRGTDNISQTAKDVVTPRHHKRRAEANETRHGDASGSPSPGTYITIYRTRDPVTGRFIYPSSTIASEPVRMRINQRKGGILDGEPSDSEYRAGPSKNRRAHDPVTGPFLPKSRTKRSRPRRPQSNATHLTHDPLDGNNSGSDGSPNRNYRAPRFKRARQSDTKRRREPSFAGSSGSSISLGTVQYEPPRRATNKKGKARMVDSPILASDDAPAFQREPGFLEAGYADSSSIFDSREGVSCMEDEEEPRVDSVDEAALFQQYKRQKTFQAKSSMQHKKDRHVETTIAAERHSESPEVIELSSDESTIPELPLEVMIQSTPRAPRRRAFDRGRLSAGSGSRQLYDTDRGSFHPSSSLVPPKPTHSIRSGKQVMFAVKTRRPEHSSSTRLPPSPTTNSALSTRPETPYSRQQTKSTRESTERSQSSRMSQTSDANRRFSELEADLSRTPQTPRRAMIAQAPAKSSEIAFISRIGLGMVLEMLGKKYGLSPEVVEEVYAVEDGIQATEQVLKEMKGQIDNILYQRASSILRGDTR